ncbi:hypothetical protein WBQ88_20955 [Sphingopyxis sp. CCNWLW253]|uniref:hypothetical protein n=1 Tax=unclassified Sphingopyxis TaxID=2614943 RepID=UPI0030131229
MKRHPTLIESRSRGLGCALAVAGVASATKDRIIKYMDHGRRGAEAAFGWREETICKSTSLRLASIASISLCGAVYRLVQDDQLFV